MNWKKYSFLHFHTPYNFVIHAFGCQWFGVSPDLSRRRPRSPWRAKKGFFGWWRPLCTGISRPWTMPKSDTDSMHSFIIHSSFIHSSFIHSFIHHSFIIHSFTIHSVSSSVIPLMPWFTIHSTHSFAIRSIDSFKIRSMHSFTIHWLHSFTIHLINSLGENASCLYSISP